MSANFMERSVKPSSDVVVQELSDGDGVLLHLRSEQYFGLDSVGMRMWSVLGSTPRLADAYEQLLAEYDVQPATLEQDLKAFVERLIERELLEISSS